MNITLHDSPTPDFEPWVREHPGGSLWQSSGWMAYQRSLGRETRLYIASEARNIVASALVTIDRTAGGFSTWDIPRGPLTDGRWQMADGSEILLKRIMNDAKKERSMAIYLSPLVHLSPDFCHLISASPRLEQPSATRIIDLTLSEEQILAGMKQKGRYNIGVAARHNVTVEQSRDVSAFGRIMQETAARDRFTPAGEARYEKFLEHVPGSFLLLAYASSEPIAGLLGVIWNRQAIYYYGASSYAHRAFMAPFLLQWEAMRFAKAQGALSYDLFGISPQQKENGRWQMADGSTHPWAGITRFKEHFGGNVVTYPPEQMLLMRPWMYRALQMKRKLLG